MGELQTNNSDLGSEDSKKLAGELTDIAKKPESVSENEVVAKLEPYSERDSTGHSRVIFKHGDITFAFAARDEMPTYPTLERDSTKVLVRQPLLSAMAGGEEAEQSETQFALYSEQAEKAREPGEHILVEHSTLGVVRLLHELQPDNQDFTTLLQELEEGQYGERALELTDKLIAAEHVGKAGKHIDDHLDRYGAAIVVLAELGDESAQSLVRQKLMQLKEIDRQSEEKRKQEARAAEDTKLIEEIQPLKPEQIVCVHSTRYEPVRDESGRVVLHDTFDHTGYPRASLHFTLNHKVESHMMGDWSENRYTILAPLPQMIDTNGLPRTMYGVDTWWVRNPGEALVCPDALIVELDENIEGEREREGNVIKINPRKVDPDQEISRIIAEDLGRPVIRGGQHYTSVEPAITKLAGELGVPPRGLHIYSPESGQENKVGNYLNTRDLWEFGSGDTNTPTTLFYNEMSPEARRVAMASGTIAPVQIVMPKADPDMRY